MAYRAAFAVVQRLSRLKNANRINVMADGRIMADANDDDLMAQGSHYAELYNTYFLLPPPVAGVHK